jgi:hypothetical protein
MGTFSNCKAASIVLNVCAEKSRHIQNPILSARCMRNCFKTTYLEHRRDQNNKNYPFCQKQIQVNFTTNVKGFQT